MQKSPDVNLYSFTKANSGTVVDWSNQQCGKDFSPTYSDTIKITDGCSSMSLVVDEIHGGNEDCVDINNHASENHIRAKFYPRGKFLATIKGAALANTLEGEVFSHGTETDVDLGNNSKQSNDKTGVQIIALISRTGKPIRIRVLNAEIPNLVEGTGPYEYSFPDPNNPLHPVIIFFFKIGCKLGIV